MFHANTVASGGSSTTQRLEPLNALVKLLDNRGHQPKILASGRSIDDACENRHDLIRVLSILAQIILDCVDDG